MTKRDKVAAAIQALDAAIEALAHTRIRETERGNLQQAYTELIEVEGDLQAEALGYKGVWSDPLRSRTS